jgi:RimJ/RimL family protein N-acetyltransferase
VLSGEKVVLRARLRADVPAYHQVEWADAETHQLLSVEPWTPRSLEQSYAAFDRRVGNVPDDAGKVVFTVAGKEDPDRALGFAGLYDLSSHCRSAHAMVALLPDTRGQGLGRDALRILCHYGFRLRGLHRISLETQARNVAMQRAAEAVGFVREGVRRETVPVNGAWEDEVVYGLLAPQWSG